MEDVLPSRLGSIGGGETGPLVVAGAAARIE